MLASISLNKYDHQPGDVKCQCTISLWTQNQTQIYNAMLVFVTVHVVLIHPAMQAWNNPWRENSV